MCSQNAGKAICETQILKISWGHAPRPPWLTRACDSRLTPSASHTILGGEQRKWALWQFCPTTEECLKNALTRFISRVEHDISRVSAANK
jgi:hypothetical protein